MCDTRANASAGVDGGVCLENVLVCSGQGIVGHALAPMSTWLDRVRANATLRTWLGKQCCLSHGDHIAGATKITRL